MPEKILIIDDDVDTLRLVGMMLQKQGYQIVAATNGQQGLDYAESEDPDLVLLDVMMPQMDGYEVARRLRANPFTASIPILMFTAKTQLDDKVTGFEAGADDYLTKPTHPSELIAHVKALLARSTKGRAAPAGAVTTERRSFVIGVLAARGGWGVTTTAANLGSALKTAANMEVTVCELRPGQGTLGPEMGEADPRTLVELLQAKPVDLTRQKVNESLYTHKSGVRFLFGSIHPKDASLLGAVSQIETLVNRLIYLSPYLVLDLGPSLPPLTQKMLKVCKLLVVVVEPMPNSVVYSKALIADLLELGFTRDHIVPIVINRIRSDMQLNWNQVQERLGHPVAVAVMPAPELIYMAARMKMTAFEHQPSSLLGQQFSKLAAHLLDLEKSMG